MTALKSYPLLLLILPLLIVCPPTTSARRVLKGGCLNYGHSCLGAHGKRASWHPDVQLPAPTSQPIRSRPLLNVLLDALNGHPEALATFHHPKEDSTPQSSDAFLQGVRYNNGRIINVPNIQDEEDPMGGAMIPDVLMGNLGIRMSGRDARTSDRLDDESEADALYFLNVDDYADDRVRRSAIENAPTTKEGKKESDQEWEKEGKERMNHKGEEDNIDLRLYANWPRV